MKAVVREIGERPPVMTTARINAPQGAKALADIFAEQDFADLCVLNIDWGSVPPALVIDTIGWYRDWPGERLSHQFVIELEDAFARNNMDRSTLLRLVAGIREVFESKVEARRKTGNRRAGDIVGEVDL